ncbi:hypothetical protein MVEN_00913000 [Mycena venus]|uniref:Uncharacterized protein n=1 Tax=Mycena venus TaxID=2733690 RepID=A0A8H6YBU6_9AGAR|nr:hypothetical protein MVEN_00913000 [Mycena venus]
MVLKRLYYGIIYAAFATPGTARKLDILFYCVPVSCPTHFRSQTFMFNFWPPASGRRVHGAAIDLEDRSDSPPSSMHCKDERDALSSPRVDAPRHARYTNAARGIDLEDRSDSPAVQYALQGRAGCVVVPLCPPDADAGSPDDLHSQLFILLKSTVKLGLYTLRAHPTINDNGFTYKEFNALNNKFKNPLMGPDKCDLVWVWIAPRYGHLVGPIDRFSTLNEPLSRRHPSYGLCLLDSLPTPHAAGRNAPLDI